MPIFIDNTGLVRVTEVEITAVDGTSALSTLAGEFTIYDSNDVEVTGQTWPTALTLNTAGDYGGIIESDVAFVAGSSYNVKVNIGTTVNDTGEFNHTVIPVERTSVSSTWVSS